MNVLIIGSGGREHALAWKVAQSELVEKVWVAPGNAGTAAEKKVENTPINPTEVMKLVEFAKLHNIDLTIIGPEAALAAGVTDAFTDAGLKCFGPTASAAMLESSKQFSKDFMREFNIPTAAYATFTNTDEAIKYVKNNSLPIVIKADGLAAGKGVVIAETIEQAIDTIQLMLEGNQFGEAGHKIIIEEFLDGEELSYIVMCDGKNILPLASSQDHKRRDNNDQGPNTGGMGAYSPAPLATKALEEKIIKEVIEPTVAGMNQRGTPYIGFLYAGLMIKPNQEIKVLEFNCRMGDPETQPIMMRLESDLNTLCLAALAQKLNQQEARWSPQKAVAVVMAAGGYPLNYNKGDIITGLKNQDDTSVKVFHAGTKTDGNNILTNGGRVLAITALADTLRLAQQKAYDAIKNITWVNAFYRTDIGYKGVEHEP